MNIYDNKRIFNCFEILILLLTIIISQLFNQSIIVLLLGFSIMIYSFFAPVYKIFFMLSILLGSAEELTFISSFTIPTAVVITFLIRHFIESVREKKIKVDGFTIFSSLLILFGIFNYFLTNSYSQLITSIKGYAFLVLLSDLFDMCKEHKYSIEELFAVSIRFVGMGLIISSVVALLAGNSFNTIGRFSFGNSTINIIGIQCAIVVVSLLYIITTKFKKYVIDLFVSISCSFIIFLTMSKTAILMVFLGVILLLLCGLVKKHYIKLFFSIIIMIIIGFCLYKYNDNVNNMVNKIVERFSVDDISNGRYDLWDQTMNKMRSNTQYSFFGAGDYIFIGAVGGKKGEIFMAHNFILETWVIYGYIGCFMILLQYATIIKRKIKLYDGKRNGRINILGLVPIITLTSGLFYSHHFIGRVNSILFVLCFIPVFIKNERTKEVD